MLPSVWLCGRFKPVAVGIPVTRHPPHRSVRALISAYGSSLRCWRPTARRTPPNPWHTRSPSLCRERVGSGDVLLGPRPSLHRLRRRLPLFVQQLHRYCCVVRLLQNVHIRRAAFAFADRSRPSWGRDALEVSRFSCTKLPGVSGVYDYAGLTADSRLAPSVMLPSAKSTASAS